MGNVQPVDTAAKSPRSAERM